MTDRENAAREFAADFKYDEFWRAVAYSGYRHATDKLAEIMADFADKAVADAVRAERERIAEKVEDLLSIADDSMGDFYAGACEWMAKEFAAELKEAR